MTSSVLRRLTVWISDGCGLGLEEVITYPLELVVPREDIVVRRRKYWGWLGKSLKPLKNFVGVF